MAAGGLDHSQSPDLGVPSEEANVKTQMADADADSGPDIDLKLVLDPTIFCCKSCGKILTDSTAVVATCRSLQMLIFGGMSFTA